MAKEKKQSERTMSVEGLSSHDLIAMLNSEYGNILRARSNIANINTELAERFQPKEKLNGEK